MTQPPDDRPRPDQPEGETGPDNEPTVAWTPPEPEGDEPPEEGGVGYAAVPEESPTSPEAPGASPDDATQATPLEPTPPVPPPVAPSGPIISATPASPASEWQTPGQPVVPPPVPPGGGWQLPAAAATVAQQDGYVIAGVGARIVGWLIDILLAGIVPAVLYIAVVDYAGLMREAIEQARLDPRGQFTNPYAFTIPVTLDLVLVTLIGLGIQFLYFVGFWTSRWRATPGMIGLKLRVVDAGTGGTLSVVEATKRFIALGWPLSLLTLVPALQSAGGLIQFGLVVLLFFTTVTNDRRQGLHDKWANSLVIRSVTSGNGATLVGCLVWVVLVILFGFIISTVVLAAVLPELQELIREIPTNPV
jgi:uncharacterized RDD family membrane protein YckC